MIAGLLAGFVRLFTGVQARWVGCAPDDTRRIYFANHTSNFDFLVLWSVLPEAARKLGRWQRVTIGGEEDFAGF